jgi:predicted AAA+ superfamily ATPase
MRLFLAFFLTFVGGKIAAIHVFAKGEGVFDGDFDRFFGFRATWASNYKFIIFMDDLSFEEDESDYKELKAMLEGALESRSDRVLIYATSNRRHLIRETWGDRQDMEYNEDIHRSDTMEEKLSLAARFGVAISFSAPDRKLFHEIVRTLAQRGTVMNMDESELLQLANRWEIRHGGLSGRTAQQFIHYLEGKESLKNHVDT